MISQGRGLEALQQIETLLSYDPFDVDYIDKAIKAAEVAGLHEVAAMTIEAACDYGTKDSKLLEKAATYYTIAKHYDKVVEIYKKILTIEPMNQRIIQLLKNAEAQATIMSGWEQNAGKQGATMELLANPEQAKQLDRQGKANIVSEDANALASEYLQKISANPNDLNSYRALARIYLKSKQLDEAVDIMQKAIAISKSDPEMDKMLSSAKIEKYNADIKMLEEEGNYDSANELVSERDQFMFDDLQSRVNRYPNDLHLRFQLGQLYFKFEYFDEAIEHLQLAQKSPKDRLDALYLLAMCFIKKQQVDLGVMQLETAASQIQTMTDLKKKILYQLGRCAEDAGKIEEAYNYYRDVYSTDISFEDLNERMLVLSKKIKEK